MKILSIETSCDETSTAIVEDGREVLANVIFSQIALHAKTGGVVPEVAARVHIMKMIKVLDEALLEAKCDWDDIDALAVTRGPGLVSSLIIGTQTANVVSFVKQKPLIPVQHICGHIYSNWLLASDGGEVLDEPQFPILILTVSGGHNELILMKDHYDFEVIGESLDDAAGEAFDKVARILGMGYPGGPAISKAALEGDSACFALPRVMMEKDSLNFSFSGLKTAVLTIVKDYAKENNFEFENEIDEGFKNDLAASFQEAVVETLAGKMVRAYEMLAASGVNVREVHLAGGVSANKRLREVIAEKFSEKSPGILFRSPAEFAYCTDNAAMIGAAGYYLWEKEPGKFQASANIVPTTGFRL